MHFMKFCLLSWAPGRRVLTNLSHVHGRLVSHSQNLTNTAPVALQRASISRPHLILPLGGTEVGCKVGLQRASWGSPPLSLLSFPTLPCASWFSASMPPHSLSRGTGSAGDLVPLGDYRRQAYCMPSRFFCYQRPAGGPCPLQGPLIKTNQPTDND